MAYKCLFKVMMKNGELLAMLLVNSWTLSPNKSTLDALMPNSNTFSWQQCLVELSAPVKHRFGTKASKTLMLAIMTPRDQLCVPDSTNKTETKTSHHRKM